MQLVSLLLKRHRAVSLTTLVFLVLTVVLTTYFLLKVNREKSVAVALNTALLKEQKQRQTASQKASEYMFNNSMHNYHARKFDETLPLLLQAVELNAENTGAWRYLAYNYLGELQADKALEALGNVNDEGGRFLQEKARLLKSLTENGRVPVKNAVKFREHMTLADANFRKAVAHHVNYTVTRKYSLEERIEYAEHSLSMKLGQEVKFDRVGDVLKLSLGKYKKQLRDIVVLENLPIVSLDLSNSLLRDLESMQFIPLEELCLSHSSISNLKGLEKTKIKKLDVSNTEIKGFHNLPDTIEIIIVGQSKLPLRNLNNYPNLKQITVSKDSYSEKELQKYQLKAEVVYKD